MRTTNPTVS